VDPAASAALFAAEVELLRGLAMFNGGGLRIDSATYPDLVLDLPHPSGARRRFRLRCDDWNEIAPSVMPIDADGAEMIGQPVGPYWTTLNNYWGLCVPGTREYHQHHTENPWNQHRAAAPLAAIVGKVYHFYRTSAG
jgi:hypothetical protein